MIIGIKFIESFYAFFTSIMEKSQQLDVKWSKICFDFLDELYIVCYYDIEKRKPVCRALWGKHNIAGVLGDYLLFYSLLPVPLLQLTVLKNVMEFSLRNQPCKLNDVKKVVMLPIRINLVINAAFIFSLSASPFHNLPRLLPLIDLGLSRMFVRTPINWKTQV